jgi:carbon storage regulator
MLVLTRRTGETICVGDDIQVEVLEVRPGVVRLGIRAPRQVRVLRAELVAAVAEANSDAAQSANIEGLAQMHPEATPVTRRNH